MNALKSDTSRHHFVLDAHFVFDFFMIRKSLNTRLQYLAHGLLSRTAVVFWKLGLDKK